MNDRRSPQPGTRRSRSLNRLLSPEDQQRILDKIASIERGSAGEVRVHVTDRRVRDPLAAAEKTFEALGMSGTRLRNGVLVYVSLPARRFAIVGDEGFERAAGPDFWEEARNTMAERFAAGDYTDGLLAVLGRVEAVLIRHFPREEGDVNELPDEISFPAARWRGLPWVIAGTVAATAALLFLSWRLFFAGWS